MEVFSQETQKNFEPFQWDEIDLKNIFEKTSMQIFQVNQVKLNQILQNLNCAKCDQKERQILVKTFTIFQSMGPIFSRMNISLIFQQLRSVVSILSKLALSNESQTANKTSEIQKLANTQKQTEKRIQNRSSIQQKVKQISNRISAKRMGGVSLYNQSYINHLDSTQNGRKNHKNCNEENVNQVDRKDELDRQEMLNYIAGKKNLQLLKIVDHSKKYEQIQDEFSLVEIRLRKMLELLERQISSDHLKSYQFLSKQEITRDLQQFKLNNRTFLIELHDQYNISARDLRQKNRQMKEKLQQEDKRRTMMKTTSTQTNDEAPINKRVKRITEEFEEKIKSLEWKIEQVVRESKQVEKKMKIMEVSKQQQIISLQQEMNTKEQMLTKVKSKCQNIEKVLKRRQIIVSELKEAKSKTDSVNQQKQLNQGNQKSQKDDQQLSYIEKIEEEMEQEFTNEEIEQSGKSKFLNRRNSRFSLMSRASFISARRQSSDSQSSDLFKLMAFSGNKQTSETQNNQQQFDENNHKKNLILPKRGSVQVKIKKSSPKRNSLQSTFQTGSGKKNSYNTSQFNGRKTKNNHSLRILQKKQTKQNENIDQNFKLNRKQKNKHMERSSLINLSHHSANKDITQAMSKTDAFSYLKKFKSRNSEMGELASISEQNRYKQNYDDDEVNSESQKRISINIKISNKPKFDQQKRQTTRSKRIARNKKSLQVLSFNEIKNLNIKKSEQIQSKEIYEQTVFEQSSIKLPLSKLSKENGVSHVRRKYAKSQHFESEFQHKLSLMSLQKQLPKQILPPKKFNPHVTIGNKKSDNFDIDSIQKQFPDIIKITEKCENSKKFYSEILRFHKGTCDMKSCQHMEAFVFYYEKLKKSNMRRSALKLPIQNFTEA